jgi:hypothetical protein
MNASMADRSTFTAPDPRPARRPAQVDDTLAALADPAQDLEPAQPDGIAGF